MLLIHAIITWTLLGLIWNVQIVQYPLFHHVGRETFRMYHFSHCLRIGFLVIPLMFAECLTAGWLLYAGERRGIFISSLVPLALVWLSTAVFQAPTHARLTGGYDEKLVRRLCLTNWLRTLGWTARAVMLAWMIGR